MKQLITLIFVLSSLISSGQSGSLPIKSSFAEINRLTMLSVRHTTFLAGTDSVEIRIGMPIDKLIHVFLLKYNIDIYRVAVDSSKIKIKNFYYLMVGDDAAHIGRDKKLIVNDTIKAQKILSHAILNYRR